ncbi:MAG: VanZ family protein [Candidatus Omnitrophica bacterium]|nr:VanZ family protein [Candidatus Omnitrophota bacterium]
MNKKPDGTVVWAVFAVYVLTVFLSLGAAPEIWKAINASLGGKGIYWVLIVYGMAAVGALAYIAVTFKGRNIWHYLVLPASGVCYFLLIKASKMPDEKIHLAEYSIMAALACLAFRGHFDKKDPLLYVSAGALSVFLGFLDEIVQLMLPNRYFDWNDVLVNAASSILAVLVIRFSFVRLEMERS